MSQKILIFGARGWLANKFAGSLPGATLTAVNIADPSQVDSILGNVRPDVVINAAGKTGKPNIDSCETDRARTFLSNVTGPVVLAEACSKRRIYMVHLSSGCIFDGESPSPGGWTEIDVPNPVSCYGRSKVDGDFGLMNSGAKVLIERIRMPIDSKPYGRNLITKLVKYPQVIDVVNSVTVVDDLLAATIQLMEQRQTGIFNVTNPVPVRHQEILEWYREFVDPNHSYEMITVEQMYEQGLAKARRSNCVLNTKKLKDAGIKLPNAPEAIRNCLREYAKALTRT